MSISNYVKLCMIQASGYLTTVIAVKEYLYDEISDYIIIILSFPLPLITKLHPQNGR